MSTISKLVPLLRCQQRFLFERKIISPGFCVNLIRKREFSARKTESAVSKANPSSDVSTDVRPLGEKIKETTKTASYMGVILVGVGVTGIIFYYVFRELFSSKSPNSIYSAALEKCIDVSTSSYYNTYLHSVRNKVILLVPTYSQYNNTISQ